MSPQTAAWLFPALGRGRRVRWGNEGASLRAITSVEPNGPCAHFSAGRHSSIRASILESSFSCGFQRSMNKCPTRTATSRRRSHPKDLVVPNTTSSTPSTIPSSTLSSVPQRSYDDSFRLSLEKASTSAEAGYNPFALVLIDVDAFDEIRASYGPEVAQDLLSMIDGHIREELRSDDALADDSHANFALLLANSLTTDGAVVCVERIRQKIAETPIDSREPLLVTVTGAVAVWQPGLSVDQLIDAADSTLRSAKQSGTNSVKLWAP
jgi:diguanylate cyclase (GGDEF)-like protein